MRLLNLLRTAGRYVDLTGCVALTLLSLHGSAADADGSVQEWAPEPGVYRCMTQRMVGFHNEGADRFAGKVRLTPEEQRFWVKIQPPELDEDERQFCKDYPAVPGSKVSLIVWWHCAAELEATFSENKSMLPMRGNKTAEPGHFRQAAGGSFFTLSPDLAYVLFDGFDAKKRLYLEEGICEKL